MARRAHMDWLLFAGLVLLYAAVRLINLDAAVTTDEPLWLGRAANFYRALTSGELQHTYQMAHPGVLTMWAGMFAYLVHLPEYGTVVGSNLDNPRLIDQTLRAIGSDPLSMMVWAKISKVVMQTLFFAIALIYAARLVPTWIVLGTGGLIVFDPFLTGLDAALHVDGLFAIVSFAAVLAISHAVERTLPVPGGLTASWPWAAAGALCACAWLTRATGVVLVGVVVAGLLLLLIRGMRSHGDRKLCLHDVSKHWWVWLASATIVTLALLPALWYSPAEVGYALVSWNVEAAQAGHEHPTFFRGEIHTGDPGAAFYPLAMLWRTTPTTWAGVAALVVLGFWAWRTGQLRPGMVRLIMITGVFAVLYLALMTVGAKKFDRYALPVHPILNLYAALGFWLVLRAIHAHRPSVSAARSIAVLAALVVTQLASMASALPYRLDYYNPILGDTARAEQMFQLGWGQGGREVVEYIVGHTDPGRMTIVRVSGTPQALTFFLHDDDAIRVLDEDPETPAAWCATDWYVAGIQQTQRGLAPAYEWLAPHEPAHIVTVEEVAYFRIYDLRTIPSPAALGEDAGCGVLEDNDDDDIARTPPAPASRLPAVSVHLRSTMILP